MELRQRVRAWDAATICGFGVMVTIFTAAIWNIAATSPGGVGFTTLLTGTSKTLPTVILAPLGSDVYVTILVLCGAWSGYRGASPLRSGAGALKMSLIAGLPIILVGLLMLSGLLGMAVLGPGGLHTTSASGATGASAPRPVELLVSCRTQPHEPHGCHTTHIPEMAGKCLGALRGQTVRTLSAGSRLRRDQLLVDQPGDRGVERAGPESNREGHLDVK